MSSHVNSTIHLYVYFYEVILLNSEEFILQKIIVQCPAVGNRYFVSID